MSDVSKSVQEHRRLVSAPKRHRTRRNQTDAQRTGIPVLEERLQHVLHHCSKLAHSLPRSPRRTTKHTRFRKARVQVPVQPVQSGVQNPGQIASSFAVPRHQGPDEMRVVPTQFQDGRDVPKTLADRASRSRSSRLGGVETELDAPVRTVDRRQNGNRRVDRRRRGKRRGTRVRQQRRFDRVQTTAVDRRLHERTDTGGGRLQRLREEVQVPPLQSGVYQSEIPHAPQQDAFAPQGRETDLSDGKVPGPQPAVQVRSVQRVVHAEKHTVGALQFGSAFAQVETFYAGTATTAQQQQHADHIEQFFVRGRQRGVQDDVGLDVRGRRQKTVQM